MDSQNQQIYIPVRRSQINYYREVPLYYKPASDKYALYKPSGKLVAELRLNESRYPNLYISQEDRIEAIIELQRGFNQHIAENIESGNVTEVKTTLCNLVEETLAEPRSGTLKALPETVDTLVSGYSQHPDILKTFAYISLKDYTTVIHSVNVMKSHPKIGCEIIRDKSGIDDDVARGALEHHEKLDGSGYPKGCRVFSFEGQLLGIVDCYEALTNEDRPYRRAKDPLDTLKLLKKDVEAGKFSRKLFEKFCYSLI